MMAYKLQVDEVSHVTDALSAVDLKAATSSKDIAIALQQSANSASLAGVSFEKLTGYIATVEEVTQKSASTVGNSMKSMFSRLQNVKAGKFLDDTGESINDVEKVLSSLDIELRKNKDDWRSMGDVLDDVSKAWNSYSDTEKNAVATSIAGTHQRESFLALMSNYDKAMEYEKTAMDSNGQAALKYNTYLDNLEAAKNRLKATTEELVYSEDNVNTYSLVLDVLNNLLSVLKNLDPYLVILSGIMSVMLVKLGVDMPTAISKFVIAFKKAQAAANGLGDATLNLGKSSKKSGMDFGLFTTKVTNGTKAFKKQIMTAEGLIKTLRTLKTVLLTMGATYLVMGAISWAAKEIDKVANRTKYLKEEVSETEQSVADLQSSLDSLSAIKNPTEEEKKKLEMAKLQLQYQERLNKAKKEELFEKTYNPNISDYEKTIKEASLGADNLLFKNIFSGIKGIAQETSETVDELEKYDEKTVAIEKAEKGILEAKKEQEKKYARIQEIQSKKNPSTKELKEADELIKAHKKEYEAIEYLRNKMVDYNLELSDMDASGVQGKKIKELIAITDSVINVKNKEIDKNGELVKSTDEVAMAYESIGTIYTSLKDSTELATSAWSEFNDKGYLTLDTVFQLIEAGHQNVLILDEETGLYKLKANTMEEVFNSEKQLALQKIANQKASAEATLAQLKSDLEIYKAQKETAKGTVKNNAAITESSVSAMISIDNVARQVGSSLGYVSTGASRFVANAQNESKKVEAALKRVEDNGGEKEQAKMIKAKQKELKDLNVSYDALNSITFDQMTGSAYEAADALQKEAGSANSAKGATDSLKDSVDALKTELDGLKNTLSDMKDQLDKTKDAYEVFKDAIANQIESEIDALDKLKEKNDERQKYYETMKDMVSDWYDDEIEAKDELIQKAEDEADKQIDFINKKIDALDAEKNATDKLKEIEESRLEVEKAQMALDKLKGQKTQRVYKKGEGFTYETDAGAIKEQEDALKDAQNNYSELLKNWNFEQQKTALEDMIKAIEEARDRTVAALQEQVDALQKEADAWGDALDFENEAIKNNVEVQKWMTDYQKADTATRMKMLAAFNADYHDKIYKANLDTDTQIKKLQELKEQWSKSMDIAADISKYEGMQEGLKKFENATYEERKIMLSNFTTKYQTEYKKQNDAVIALESQIKELEKTISSSQNKLDGMKASADGASAALGDVKSRVNDLDGATVHIKKDTWEGIVENGVLYSVHMIDGVEVSRKRIGVSSQRVSADGSQNGNQTVITDTGKIISKYATGGLGNFSESMSSQVVSKTGRVGDSDTYVDGTPKFSELMLNASDAARVWNWVQKLPVTPTGNTVSNNSEQTSIGNITVNADSNSTLKKILTEAKGMAKTRR